MTLLTRRFAASSNPARRDQAGFSLIELLIAMVVTLIVSGAIFGLMTTGQNSFRREPEVTERQQNVRVAMDLVQRDIATAGMAMTPSVQAFTDGLDNWPAGLPSVVVPGENSDVLELAGTDGACPQLDGQPSAGAVLNTSPVPSCFAPNSLVYLPMPNNTTLFGLGTGIVAQAASIDFSGQQLPPPYPAPAPTEFNASFPVTVGLMQLVRYEVAVDPSDQSPGLWRSTTGGIDLATAAYAPPPGGAWELIARGVEDMQVQYLNGNGAWQSTPGAVVAGNLATIVQEVRVTFSARALGRNLQGETAAANVPTALRGQLTSSTVPRAALEQLSGGTPPVWQ
jgi:prepilin-type N-terminal cleavage/methylation domain-containing protein